MFFWVVVCLLLSIISIRSGMLEMFRSYHLLCLHFQCILNVLNIVGSGNDLIACHVFSTWPWFLWYVMNLFLFQKIILSSILLVRPNITTIWPLHHCFPFLETIGGSGRCHMSASSLRKKTMDLWRICTCFCFWLVTFWCIGIVVLQWREMLF